MSVNSPSDGSLSSVSCQIAEVSSLWPHRRNKKVCPIRTQALESVAQGKVLVTCGEGWSVSLVGLGEKWLVPTIVISHSTTWKLEMLSPILSSPVRCRFFPHANRIPYEWIYGLTHERHNIREHCNFTSFDAKIISIARVHIGTAFWKCETQQWLQHFTILCSELTQNSS